LAASWLRSNPRRKYTARAVIVRTLKITLPAPAVMLGIFPSARSGIFSDASLSRSARWNFASRVPRKPVAC
jgi:hypothetical protein